MTVPFADAVEIAGNMLDAAQLEVGFFLADDMKHWERDCEKVGKAVLFLFADNQKYKEYSPIQWMQDAQTDRMHFDALRLALSNCLENGLAYPNEFDVWIASQLRGNPAPPPFGAVKPTKSHLHWVIVRCIESLIDRGMKPTRANSSSAVSASDAVAKALAERCLQPITFAGVRDVWIKKNRDRLTVSVG